MYQAMLCSQRELADRVSAEVTGDVLERTMSRVEEGQEEVTRLHTQTAENLGLAFHAFKVRLRPPARAAGGTRGGRDRVCAGGARA